MTSTIINSSKEIFENMSSDKKIDVLKPVDFKAPAAALARRKLLLNPVTSVNFGTEVEFEMPRHQYLSDFAVAFGATFASTHQATTYAGLSFINRVRIHVGGVKVCEYSYKETLAYLMSKMSGQKVEDLLHIAGGSGTADKESGFIAPIPTPWSTWIGNSAHVPFFAEALNGKVQIELTLNSAANVTNAGDTAATNPTAKGLLWIYDSTPELKQQHLNAPYVYKSVDWQTIIDRSASASSGNYDVSSFTGLIHAIACIHQTDANKSTAHDYWTFSDLSEFTLKADGEELYKLYTSTPEEGILDSWLQNGSATGGRAQVGASGYIFIAPLGGPHHEQHHIGGGLNSRKINHLEVDATGVADSVVSFVAERNIQIVVERGAVKTIYI